MRTHKQDGPLLFLDHLHADVEIANTITTFFVCCCVYFTFFRKSARSRSAGDHPGHSPADNPPGSPLFVRGSSPPDNHEPDASPGPRSNERDELPDSPLRTWGDGEGRVHQQRQMREIQVRRRRLQHPSVDEELMELDQVGSDNSDMFLSDPEPLTGERLGSPAAAPQIEHVPPSSVVVHIESLEHGTAALMSEGEEHPSPTSGLPDSNMLCQPVLDDADTSSQHTRISLKAIPRA